MSVCLDSFALLAWLRREPGRQIVTEALEASSRDHRIRCFMSVLNLGEVFYIVSRRAGAVEAEQLVRAAGTREIPIALVPATYPRVLAAARLKARFPISYADGFAMATALEQRCPLVTGDPEILAVHEAAQVEVLRLG